MFREIVPGPLSKCQSEWTLSRSPCVPVSVEWQQVAETREGETNAQLRCTVVWTLSRYIQWVLRQDNDGQYLAPLVERVLNATLDHNKQARRTARLLVASTNRICPCG